MKQIIFFKFICILFCVAFTVTSTVHANTMKAPIIKNVGSIPANWQNYQTNDTGLNNFINVVNLTYLDAVRSSNKFKVINDALVAKLWNTAEGRQELVEDFELDAFFSLNVLISNDLATLTARVLDKDLKPLIAESDTLGKVKFFSLAPDQLIDRLENLVFRAANRIPVDVFITSIQGNYVTLSGGKNKNVEIGDVLDITKVYIDQIHPADGTWLEYRRELAGNVQVIDVKDTAAIANIVKQTYPGAIEVNDSAKLKDISSRQKFAKPVTSSLDKPKDESTGVNQNTMLSEKDKKDDGTIVLNPLIETGEYQKQVMQEKTLASVPQAEDEEAQAAATQGAQPGEEKVKEKEDDEGFFSAITNTGLSIGKEVNNIVAYVVDTVTFNASMNMWSLTSPISTKSQLPIFLINEVGTLAHKPLFNKIHSDFGGSLLFGSTERGDYNGIKGLARVYWNDSIALLSPSPSEFNAGVFGAYHGLGVTGDNFGGGDVIEGGVFVRLYNDITLDDGKSALDSYAELALSPLSIGRYGINGNNRSIKSSLGWQFKLGGYMPKAKEESIRWGGEFSYESKSHLLNGTKEFVYSNITISLLADYTL